MDITKLTKTEKELYNHLGGYKERWDKAVSDIKDGGRFNGTVYSKKANKNNMDLSVYINNNYVNLGRVYPKEVAELKDLFLTLIKTTPRQTKDNDTNSDLSKVERKMLKNSPEMSIVNLFMLAFTKNKNTINLRC